MPLIPERLQSRQDVKSAIACQFWEQPSHSTRSIDGLVWSLPCEPPALNLTGSSGLSRTQQLIAAQAVGAPAVPSYDANSEGLVLDRVLGKLGGKSWWTAVAGRVKVQRMLRLARQATGGKRKIHTLRDLDSYGVVARGRFQLGRRLTLNAVVETPTATLLHKRARRHAAAVARVVSKWVQPAQGEATAAAPDAAAGPSTTPSTGTGTMPNGLSPAPEPHSSPADGEAHASAPPPLPTALAAAAATVTGPASPRGGAASPRAFPTSPRAGSSSSAEGSVPEPAEPLRGHASLKYVLPGHDLTATLGWQQDYVDSSGEYAHVPLAASLDLASQYRPDGLQYRVGLHQVTAPAVEGSSKAARRMRTTLHIQGAVAVEGEAHIWKPAPPATQQQQQAASPPAAQSSAAPTPNSTATVQGAAPAPGGPAAGSEGAPTKTAAQEQQGGGGAGGQGQQQQQQQDSQPKEEKPAGRVATALTAAAEADAGPDLGTLPPRRPRGEKKKKKHKSHKRHKEAEHQHQHHHHHRHHHHHQQGEEGQERHGEQEQHSGQGPAAAASDTAGASADLGEPHQTPPSSEAAGEEAGAASAVAVPPAATKPSNSGGGSRQGRGGGSDEPADAEEGGAGGKESAAAPAGREAGGGHGGEAEGEHSRASLESFIRPLGDLIHTVTHPREGQQQPGGAGAGPSGAQQQQQQQQRRGGRGAQHQLEGEAAGEEGPPHSPSPTASNLHFLTVSAKTIQAGIQESLALLEQVKESVGRLTTEVQEGSLQRLGKQLADSSGRKEVPSPRRRPYSVFLSQPHLKLNGSMGCLARMPLPPLRGCTGLAGLDVGAPAGGGGGMRGGSSHPPGASSASLSSLGSTGLAQAWEPYLKGTSLRLFASGGISGQLGRFTRPFLDYTAAALRVDVGLTSPHVVGLLPDPSSLVASDTHRPDKHRAFALEGRGSWHSLSASLAQQVVGPVRARADFRFALDPTNMPQNAGERSTIKGLVQTALSVRPSLLEAVFGFDVVLPGTEGAARLACWWSPHRKEAMAELRLF